jgi:hypothetical protein
MRQRFTSCNATSATPSSRSLSASPGFVMGQALKAYLHLLGTEPNAIAIARECYASNLPANARERGHLEAVRQLVEGRWHAAGL